MALSSGEESINLGKLPVPVCRGTGSLPDRCQMMKIWVNQAGHWIRVKTLIEALPIGLADRPVISAVGGGGKTSTLYQLAGECSALGWKVLLTTSTHMLLPEPANLLTCDPAQIGCQLTAHRLAWLGQPAGHGKMKGVPDPLYREMCDLADIVLVEADGSRQLPLKLPAIHEPVIPENTTHVLVLAGLSALGQPVQTACHRPELVTHFLGVDGDHRLDAADMARILREGYWLPGVAAHGTARTGTVLLNQADDEDRLAGGQQIANQLAPIPCLITQLQEPPDNLTCRNRMHGGGRHG